MSPSTPPSPLSHTTTAIHDNETPSPPPRLCSSNIPVLASGANTCCSRACGHGRMHVFRRSVFTWNLVPRCPGSARAVGFSGIHSCIQTVPCIFGQRALCSSTVALELETPTLCFLEIDYMGVSVAYCLQVLRGFNVKRVFCRIPALRVTRDRLLYATVVGNIRTV